jgi:hypothetical protein
MSDEEGSLSAAGPVPELFPLQRQTVENFAGADGLWFGWSKGRFRIKRASARWKTLHEFPLTEQGWTAAWQMMSAQYPQLSEKVAFEIRLLSEDLLGQQVLARLATYAELQDCTLLGGHGWRAPTLVPGSQCVLRFTERGLWVRPPSGWTGLIHSLYTDALALEFSGPGRVKTGGRIFGGGFGPVAAAEGMIAASVLNALTTRTEIHTVIRYQATDLEAFFFYSQATPDELRVQLSKVLSHIRPKGQVGAPVAAPVTRLDQLKQLGELRDSGVLSQAEFETEKQKLLASD